MAAPQPTPPRDQPPPELPSMPDVSDTLSRYLRTFSLWCREGFRDRLPSTAALPEVLLQGCNAPPGTTPAVWSLQMGQAGGMLVTPISLGSGDRGTSTISGMSSFLPLYGGTITGNLNVTGSFNAGSYFTPLNIAASGIWTYAAFYDSANNRQGYVGYNASDGTVQLNRDGGAQIRLSTTNCVITAPTTISGLTSVAALTVNRQTLLASTYGWIANPAGGYSDTNITSTGNNDCYMTLLVPSSYGVNFGLNQNGYTYRGGWTDGNNYYANWTAREVPSPACDYRFKRDIEPLKSTWGMVKALRPISYRQKEFVSKRGGHPLMDDDDRERFGFIAHELQEVLGETAAHRAKDDPDVLQAPNMNMVVAALLRTVQELQARVEQLEGSQL